MPDTPRHTTLTGLFDAIADAIRNKGVGSADGDLKADDFDTSIGQIMTLVEGTSGDDAGEGDLLFGKKAHTANGVAITGTISSKAAATYNVSTDNQEIASGQYLSGKQTFRGVTTSNISAGNIKYGITVKVGDAADDDRIKGVEGTFSGSTTVTGTGVTAASAGDILKNKAAFLNGAQVTGTISSKDAATYNTSTSDQEIASGQYLSGKQTIKAVTTSNITAGNIKYGTTIKVGDANDDDRIKGVEGTFSGSTTVTGTGKSAASAGDILTGKSAFLNGAQLDGTMANNGATGEPITAQGGTYTIPAGYTSGGTVTANITTESPSQDPADTAVTVTPATTGNLLSQVTINAITYSDAPTVTLGYGTLSASTVKGRYNAGTNNVKIGLGTGNNQLTAKAAHILSGYRAIGTDSAGTSVASVTGTMTNNGAGKTDRTLDSTTTSIDIAAGYWSSKNTVSISVATLAETKTALGIS